MSKGSSRLLLWLLAIPVAGLVLGHLAFWVLVDLIGEDSSEEGVPLVLAVLGAASFVITAVGLLARRAGKRP